MTVDVSRRTVLAVGAAGVGAAALAACSKDDSGGPVDSGQKVVALADVPVGGAVAVTFPGGKKGFVGRPADGEVVGFSSKCTHAGCEVALQADTITCPCHQSRFQKATGAVIAGSEARSDLERINVKISGQDVMTA